MNYNQLAKDIHADNRAKGFWEKPRSSDTLMMLVITEIAEATEAVRANLPPVCLMNDEGKAIAIEVPDINSFTYINGETKTFKKPEGEAVELVDALVRILDVIGSENINVDLEMPLVRDQVAAQELWEKLPNEAPARHLAFVRAVDAVPKSGIFRNLTLAGNIGVYESYFKLNGWDLEKIIQLKLAYNRTRDHRHGGKVY